MLHRRHRHSAGAQVAALYRQHGTAVFRFAYHLTGVRQDAEDIVQATFLSAHRRLQAGEDFVNPAAWLMTVAKHAAYKLARDRREVPTDRMEQYEAASDDTDDDPAVALR